MDCGVGVWFSALVRFVEIWLSDLRDQCNYLSPSLLFQQFVLIHAKMEAPAQLLKHVLVMWDGLAFSVKHVRQ